MAIFWFSRVKYEILSFRVAARVSQWGVVLKRADVVMTFRQILISHLLVVPIQAVPVDIKIIKNSVNLNRFKTVTLRLPSY